MCRVLKEKWLVLSAIDRPSCNDKEQHSMLLALLRSGGEFLSVNNGFGETGYPAFYR